jgi:hypothetical protein
VNSAVALCLALVGLASLSAYASPSARQTQVENPVIKNDFLIVEQFKISNKPLDDLPIYRNDDFPLVLVRLHPINRHHSSNTAAVKKWLLGDIRYVAVGASVDEGALTNGREFWIQLQSAPPSSSFADDAVKLDPKHNELLLDNDRVRFVRIHFAPGESGPMVDKRARVIIVLTDSHASVTLPDGHNEVRDGKAGTVSFGNAGRQATNNIGSTPLENIVVELKSK